MNYTTERSTRRMQLWHYPCDGDLGAEILLNPGILIAFVVLRTIVGASHWLKGGWRLLKQWRLFNICLLIPIGICWHLLASIGIYFFLRRWTQHMSHTTIHSDPFHGRGLSSASYLHRRILMQKKEVQLCPGIEHWCTGVLSASGPNTVCNFFLRC